MRRSHFGLVGTVIGFFITANVYANVTYQWHSTSPGPTVTATGGELVFTNAAYFSGSADFEVPGQDEYEGCPDHCRITNSPVISARLTFVMTDDGPASGVSVQPGTLYFAESLFPFSLVVTFNNDGTLTGNLFLYDGYDEASAAGIHYDWSVFNYGSDDFVGQECGAPTCNGGSGYWQLSSVTPVPEPPIWPLFGIGALVLLGLGGSRNWHRSH